MPPTVLCIATYKKGDEFIEACARSGCRVLLLTEEALRDAAWPRPAIHSFHFLRRGMPEEDIRKGAAYLARTETIDRIVALDDFDVELAAMLREHLQVPGMGSTVARGFRDKLAMRSRARAAQIRCPEFVSVLNDRAIAEWTSRVVPPWVLKPRGQAAAIGIQRIASVDQLQQALDALGDLRGDYLLEQFVPGDVFHVDSLVVDGRVVFAAASVYRSPPMTVVHEGGIFVTRTLDAGDRRAVAVTAANAGLLGSFGLQAGASHTEFILAHDGEWYFLETSARVGGAFIVDVVEAATGINLWREWARIEIGADDGSYALPRARNQHAGIVLSLARQQQPDTSAYVDPEIVGRVAKPHHAGLIVASADPQRVESLLDSYVTRFYQDFHASAPPPQRATD